ncbi:MAG: YicC family protein [Hyphomicrobium sp.]|nr:MAG: YicC family protein [Hyphomicrobium sp.]
MSLKSMTGFARADGALSGVTWHWEARSVNGRGLDVRVRLPPGYDHLEPTVREAVGKRMVRGSVTVNLSLQREGGTTHIRLNEAALAQVLTAIDRVRQLTGSDRVRPEAVLALRGVLEITEPVDDDATIVARNSALLASLDTALDGLVSARRGEGRRLEDIMAAQLTEIDRQVGIVEKAPGRTIEAVKSRLAEQVARLVESSSVLDPQRLAQEAVLAVTRADVEEELKRLRTHIEAARELLAEPGAVGRKFDFLAQEFNREANTLCSKASDPDSTRAGLALKTVIDQMREQVQNIE